MTDPFIPQDLAVAPNPLGLMPNLKLVTIPVDAYTFFEVWMPTENANLVAEEAMLLQDDRPRLEEICGKLTWLLGATLAVGETTPKRELLYDWRSLVNLLSQSDKRFDVITVAYTPLAIHSSAGSNDDLKAWTVHPPTWCVSFWQLNAIDRGFLPVLLPVTLWLSYGQPASKPVEASSIGMRYD